MIPFFAANFSHFVAAFGAGRGFSRGNGVVGGGSVMKTPASLEAVIGHVVRSWFRSDWAQSRAVRVRASLVEFGGRGLLSETRRLPRSKV